MGVPSRRSDRSYSADRVTLPVKEVSKKSTSKSKPRRRDPPGVPGLKSARRMGAPGSPTWHAMLDAAEDILREDGYGALTSRAVAERMGLKQRLVYYYFHTMDVLIVETFKRLAIRELARLASAHDGQQSLWAIWDLCVHTADTRLVSEFMALANRIEALRIEVVHFIEGSRKIQVSALSRAMGSRRSKSSLAPEAVAILATSVALSLQREAALGVRMGHAEITASIGGFISQSDQPRSHDVPTAGNEAPGTRHGPRAPGRGGGRQRKQR